MTIATESKDELVIDGIVHISSRRAAALWGIQPMTARIWRSDGRRHCPWVRLNGRIWYPLSLAEKFRSEYRASRS